jgi:hypothetical protein
MQCPRCTYISFKSLKKCENCDVVFGKAKKGRPQGDNGVENVAVFSIAPAFAPGQLPVDPFAGHSEETSVVADSSAELRDVMVAGFEVADPIFTESGDFELDLADAIDAIGEERLQEEMELGDEKIPSGALDLTRPFEVEATSQLYNESEELDEINLGEIEVEGLGFENLDEEYSVQDEEVSMIADSDESNSGGEIKLDLNEPQGEPYAEENGHTRSILDELDLDFGMVCTKVGLGF